MKWRGRRQSTNVIDRRGASGGGGRLGPSGLGGMLGGGSGGGPLGGGLGGGRLGGGLGGGIGLVVVLVIVGIWYFTQSGTSTDTGTTTTTTAGDTAPVAQDEMSQFVRVVLADTEDTWTRVFNGEGLGDYPEPQLVLFSGSTSTACGFANSATGPFYCPADRLVYIDLSFYQELQSQFGAPGDFAQAYVIAHEVGHHVQNLLGTLNRQPLPGDTENENSIRIELQADCYAGIWAAYTATLRDADGTAVLEPGDIEEALNAAAQIGDDAIQRRTQGYVVPESFNHGTSAQRQRWFQTGYQSGSVAACDTFSARTL
ncbi:MAG: KPN_02809 family neutral zinc metallopeptidase [Bauldia sp.]